MASAASVSPKESQSPALASTAAAAAVSLSSSPSSSPAPSPSPIPAPAAHPLATLTPPVPTTPSSGRRLAAPCWAHEETLALIDAYRDKWYALRWGNLRANHWQEVADEVARRSAASSNSSSKTSVQCRHKVEKLRKRYRNERQKSIQLDASLPLTSNWVYFRKMDAMERGATNARLRRPSPSTAHSRPPPPSDDEDDDDDDEEEEEEQRRHGSGGNTRSLHRLMSNGAAAPGSAVGELRFTFPKAVRSKVSRVDERGAAPSTSMKPTTAARFFKGFGGSMPAMEDMRRKLEKRARTKEKEADAIEEMVSALRMMGDGFMRIEQRKMEMAREMEKVRMEMELKRTELILDSQRQIVDAFVKGFLGKKRPNISPDD